MEVVVVLMSGSTSTPPGYTSTTSPGYTTTPPGYTTTPPTYSSTTPPTYTTTPPTYTTTPPTYTTSPPTYTTSPPTYTTTPPTYTTTPPTYTTTPPTYTTTPPTYTTTPPTYTTSPPGYTTTTAGYESTPSLACRSGFTLVGGRCVLLEPFTQTTWQESRYLCETLGGDLVVLDSMDFYADLLTHIKDSGLDTHSYWVGGSVSDWTWLWVDGSDIRMATPLWAQSGNYSQEPDDFGDCAFLDDNRFFYMNEDDCNNNRQCICQVATSKFDSPEPASLFINTDPAIDIPMMERPENINTGDKETSVAIPTLTCSGSFVPVGGKCILVEPFTLTTWDESRYLCETFGGDLVVLDSMDFYADLLDYIEDRGLDTHDYWVGASDAGFEGTWRWVDGTYVRMGTPLWALHYSGSGYYHQEPYYDTSSEDCGLLRQSSFYYLVDWDCFSSYPCICEAPGV
ncbi:hypothetical protein Pmani_040285 [Petrolisthes manimaculis]|uniref:C-type lectin domain-containing protein n=1 Tax=Petrolisthes manimaculis TaxID=1843537 RepID=A0AAE1TKF6_9EUCA|nr:hypothetical protein Pmani_040285 [Petrolisthes manimaculis]